MNGILVLFGAAIWDLLFGEPPAKHHPVVFMGRYISSCWSRRPASGPRTLFLYGTLLVLSGAALFSLPVLLVAFLPLPAAALLSIPLLKTTFSLSGLLKAGEGVLDALERRDLPEARRRLSRDLVSRKTDDLPADEVVGATVESLAENLTDSLASPVLFFLLFGLPGAFFYRFCNTCDSMIGYHGGDTEWGGKFAARLDDLLNWIPARLTALLLLGAGGLCGEDVRSGMNALRNERTRTESPNAGWTMSVVAGLLRVSLRKRGCYVLSGGTDPLAAETIRRCLRIVRTAAGLLFASSFLANSLLANVFLASVSLQGGLHALFR